MSLHRLQQPSQVTRCKTGDDRAVLEVGPFGVVCDEEPADPVVMQPDRTATVQMRSCPLNSSRRRCSALVEEQELVRTAGVERLARWRAAESSVRQSAPA